MKKQSPNTAKHLFEEIFIGHDLANLDLQSFASALGKANSDSERATEAFQLPSLFKITSKSHEISLKESEMG